MYRVTGPPCCRQGGIPVHREPEKKMFLVPVRNFPGAEFQNFLFQCRRLIDAKLEPKTPEKLGVCQCPVFVTEANVEVLSQPHQVNVRFFDDRTSRDIPIELLDSVPIRGASSHFRFMSQRYVQGQEQGEHGLKIWFETASGTFLSTYYVFRDSGSAKMTWYGTPWDAEWTLVE